MGSQGPPAKGMDLPPLSVSQAAHSLSKPTAAHTYLYMSHVHAFCTGSGTCMHVQVRARWQVASWSMDANCHVLAYVCGESPAEAQTTASNKSAAVTVNFHFSHAMAPPSA